MNFDSASAIAPGVDRTLTFRLRRLLIPILLFCCPLTAQMDITGQGWTQWNSDRKMAYLVGFYAGLKANSAVLNEAKESIPIRDPVSRTPTYLYRYRAEIKEYYAPNLKYNFKTLISLVDVFYTDPDNLPIPAPEAIRIIMLRDSGGEVRADFLLQRERRKALEGK